MPGLQKPLFAACPFHRKGVLFHFLFRYSFADSTHADLPLPRSHCCKSISCSSLLSKSTSEQADWKQGPSEKGRKMHRRRPRITVASVVAEVIPMMTTSLIFLSTQTSSSVSSAPVARPFRTYMVARVSAPGAFSHESLSLPLWARDFFFQGSFFG